jgi:5-hydroxyisourate hydrolase-like protein (transthyretin family)
MRHLLFLLLAVPSFSAVGGKVIENHSGNPVASAEIRLLRASASELIADLETDSDGNFTLPDLANGDYHLEILKPNFISTSLPLTISNSTPAIIVRLIRCGVISGHVLDAQGQPVHSATVFAMSQKSETSPWRPFSRTDPGHETRVDETGAFRLFNLPPGQYAVAVTYGASTSIVASTGNSQAEPTGSGVILYPSTSQPHVFTVAGGEEYPNTDFSIMPTALYEVSGKIELEASQHGYWLALTAQSQPTFATALSEAASDGTFHFKGIPPGSYSLFAYGPSNGRGGLGIIVDEHALFGRMPLEVGADVEGVSIALQKARSASLILRNSTQKNACPATLDFQLVSLEDWGADLDRKLTIGFVKPEATGPLAPGRYLITIQDASSSCVPVSNTILDLSKPSAKTIEIPVMPKDPK